MLQTNWSAPVPVESSAAIGNQKLFDDLAADISPMAKESLESRLDRPQSPDEQRDMIPTGAPRHDAADFAGLLGTMFQSRSLRPWWAFDMNLNAGCVGLIMCTGSWAVILLVCWIIYRLVFG